MTLSNYSAHQTPQLRVLSEAQCHELYLATLECLNRIGVLVLNGEARELLAAAGAQIEGQRARIPPPIIQEALLRTPPAFSLWGRGDRHELRISPGRVYFGPGPTCTYFIDPQSGERRKARRGDAGLTARVCDALPNIDYAMSLSLPDDVQPMLCPVYEFSEMIANTAKPVVAWANDLDTLQDIYKMATAVAGGEQALRRRPTFAYFTTFESPLRHDEKKLTNLIWAARQGVPIVYLGGPTVGLESPVTGASGLVIFLAAALSGLAIIQLARPGAPVIVGSVPAAMDLRTARPAYGSPEMSLYIAAAVDLTRYLGLPFMGTAGASESKLLDSQAALEAAIQILMSGLCGAGLVHDVGFLDCADIGSLELLVLSDEIIGLVKRILRGVEVSQDSIMLDLIEKVGPGGHFIAEPESVARCRSEIWVPNLLDRDPHVIWEQKGGKSAEQRVREKLRRILETHLPPPLPEGSQASIRCILQEAEARYR